MAPLQIDEKKAKDWESICAISIERLNRFFQALEGSVSNVLTFKILEQLGTDNEVGTKFVWHVTALRSLMEERTASAKEILSMLREGFKDYGWQAEQLALLDLRSSIIERVLSSDRMYFSLKYMELYSEGEKSLNRVKIYTDIKPLFSKEREKIIALLSFSKLKLEFFDDNVNQESITIFMDRTDIERLLDECKRALLKLSTVEAEFSQRRIQVITISEEQ